MVPKLSLDVMACEVMRVLQLTDSCIVPISYQVPRKVWREIHTVRMGSSVRSAFDVLNGTCASSRVQARNSMKTFTQIQQAQPQPCLLRSGGRGGINR